MINVTCSVKKREELSLMKDPLITALLQKTPEEVEIAIDNYITDTQKAKEAIITLGKVVMYLLKNN